MVRTILIRIVQEINILTKFPKAAMDEARVQPHTSPFLFKEFLPLSCPRNFFFAILTALYGVWKHTEC